MQVQPSLITPGDPFDIFYFLRNPVDTATYYIKAAIYDVRNGEQITTVTLTRSTVNSHLYFATLQAPPDPSAMGRNIVAIASVYTDSAYTTKSDAYEEQESYFLVKAQVPFAAGGGGVDYSRLREIVEDIVKGNKPDTPDMPFEALFGAIGALQRELNRVPKDLADIGPVLEAIKRLQTTLDELPDPDEVNLQPLLDAIETIPKKTATSIASVSDRWTKPIETAADKLTAKSTEAVDRVQASLATLGDKLAERVGKVVGHEVRNAEIRLTLGSGPTATQQPQPSPVSIDHLTS